MSTIFKAFFASVVIAPLLFSTLLFSQISVAADAIPATTEQALHQQWQALVSQHVKPINNGNSSAVDYAAMQLQRTQLQSYLKQLSSISQTQFDAWDKSTQLAILINAYNAWTVELILTKYPDIESIKDLGGFFSSPWDKSFIPLLGKTRSLNDIEHKLIRGSDRYNDPRIHFAVNCASIGCPALLEEAYTGAKLEQQLDAQTKRFLADTSRNYAKGDTVYLSAIFKWYGDDFTQGFAGADSVEAFLLLYPNALQLNTVQQAAAKKQQLAINFLDYNWSLNAVR
ncbi:DUF547 domain-containing protein [Shewanella inventionis]|uniref:DUF547 domain-containing protein n=1 Tax=Shewanella inventionis TaxID=1738770 RepID=A0ABQ1JET7_9GAMM|nr:DUF547 domain-containing protein [Shewanella inventionis]MCL1158313.1 DUF547 domain-containing protein [Shewanella inventionis]GGB66637.1 hypothetical protein GCM10011607_29070 [Shewanella inventionis]